MDKLLSHLAVLSFFDKPSLALSFTEVVDEIYHSVSAALDSNTDRSSSFVVIHSILSSIYYPMIFESSSMTIVAVRPPVSILKV